MPRIPCVLLDHCNDCRRATGQILPIWMIAETNRIEISLLNKDGPGSNASIGGEGAVSDDHREWKTLASAIDPIEADTNISSSLNTTLGRYVSSPDRNRWFCTKCGTQLAYTVPYDKYFDFWKEMSAPRMIDICLGTLDREVLEKEWMRPDDALWCHFAIPWVADLAKSGARRVVDGGEGHEDDRVDEKQEVKTEPLARHPLHMLNQDEGDDLTPWLKG